MGQVVALRILDTFDFLEVREPGIYAIEYAGQRTETSMLSTRQLLSFFPQAQHMPKESRADE